MTAEFYLGVRSQMKIGHIWGEMTIFGIFEVVQPSKHPQRFKTAQKIQEQEIIFFPPKIQIDLLPPCRIWL